VQEKEALYMLFFFGGGYFNKQKTIKTIILPPAVSKNVNIQKTEKKIIKFKALRKNRRFLTFTTFLCHFQVE